MKTFIKIVAVLFICCLGYGLIGYNRTSAQDTSYMTPSQNPPQENQNHLPVHNDTGQEMEEDDSYSYEPDILSRKVFQKKLDPLSNKEKIIWSFRMADTNSFL